VSPRSPANSGSQVTVVESVRCLKCGAVYAKPRAGGTVLENPGCPECGYVGWAASTLSAVSEGRSLPRSAVGRRPHHFD
jgi:phage FluMu protein Com